VNNIDKSETIDEAVADDECLLSLDEEVSTISTTSTLSLSENDLSPITTVNDYVVPLPSILKSSSIKMEKKNTQDDNNKKNTQDNKNNTQDNNKNNNTQDNQLIRAVRFGSIEIHEHAVELGSCCVPSTRGPSIQLEWNEQAYYKINSTTEYETLRESSSSSSSSSCRHQQRRLRDNNSNSNSNSMGSSSTSTSSSSSFNNKKKLLLLSRNQRINMLLLSDSCTYRQIQQNEEECDTIRQKRYKTEKRRSASMLFYKLCRLLKSKVKAKAKKYDMTSKT
jgi:hypothetical protein